MKQAGLIALLLLAIVSITSPSLYADDFPSYQKMAEQSEGGETLTADTFPGFDSDNAIAQAITEGTSDISDREYLNMKVRLISKRMDNEHDYVIALSILSLVMFSVSFLFLRNKEYDTNDIIHLAGLNIIIFGTILLVLIVETNEQLTAAIGILGAIAGYLFRSLQEKEKTKLADTTKTV